MTLTEHRAYVADCPPDTVFRVQRGDLLELLDAAIEGERVRAGMYALTTLYRDRDGYLARCPTCPDHCASARDCVNNGCRRARDIVIATTMPPAGASRAGARDDNFAALMARARQLFGATQAPFWNDEATRACR